MKVDQKEKMQCIMELYKKMTINQVIIFVNVKVIAQKLKDFLESNKISCSILMGGDQMKKEDRDLVFDAFIKN